MQLFTYVVSMSLSHNHRNRPCQLCMQVHCQRVCEHKSHSQSNDRGHCSGNETACVHAYKIRKWRPTQHRAVSQCCEQPFDQGKFEAMKTLSGCEAAHCDEH